jgi:hypothetical protein
VALALNIIAWVGVLVTLVAQHLVVTKRIAPDGIPYAGMTVISFALMFPNFLAGAAFQAIAISLFFTIVTVAGLVNKGARQ